MFCYLLYFLGAVRKIGKFKNYNAIDDNILENVYIKCAKYRVNPINKVLHSAN